MSEVIRMPRLSDTMNEGIIASWLTAEGEPVVKGEPLCEIDMDKATMSFDSPISGLVVELICAEGDAVSVGQPIARVEPS